MAATASPHLTNIPHAVRIAASVDPSVDTALKQQAIGYLTKVKDLCEETWQDCLSLYMQGAGAAGPSTAGKDGKSKQETDLRMFCQQVVDTVLINKPKVLSSDAQRAMYDAVMEFVKTEWVEGQCEGNQSFLRNKLVFTLAHLFINTYPSPVPNFLHPFFALLDPPDPSSSKRPNFHPVLLATRLFHEIALEIHDATMKSAREWSKERQHRDGVIREAIRSHGDERLAVEGMLKLAEKGVAISERGGEGRAEWVGVVEQSLTTLVTWTPWVDLAVSLTPQTLAFYHRLLNARGGSIRIAALSILKTFAVKGIQNPSERLQVLRILDIVNVLDPFETATRGSNDSEDIQFRAAIGGLLSVYGVALVAFVDNTDIGESLRNDAETMVTNSFPLLLRMLSDKMPEVHLSLTNFVMDLLRLFRKRHMPSTTTKGGAMPPPPTPLPADRRHYLSTLLDVSVRQLAWPDDAEWEAPNEDADPDDEIGMMTTKRIICRTFIEAIAAIDKSLHTEVVGRIVVSTSEALQTRGASAVPWQQAELALHLVFSFGELNKANTRAAFYQLPDDLSSKSGRDRARRISINKQHVESASGRSTPSDGINDDTLAEKLPGVYYGGKDKIDYEQFPLTDLGNLLNLCISSGVINYPHPSVPLQYFEIAVRYVDFWRSKSDAVSPMIEAMLSLRGIQHPDEGVRRRCFYLFTRFVKECKMEIHLDMVPPILKSLRDKMTVTAVLPTPDTPDEDVLLKATTGKTYFQDQLHLFEGAGNLVWIAKTDAERQMAFLEAIAGPFISAIGEGIRRPQEPQAVLQVHHNLMALGNFAKGFSPVPDTATEIPPYQPPFKQMTEALLEALEAMKTQRIVRDSARFAFSQFVSAIGSSIAELVPRFVSAVVTEFDPSELVDFISFLSLLMHRLKRNTFETMDMLLLPLLSRIFAVLQAPITGTDEQTIHRRLKDAYLTFFTALMNANLDGVFITDRNKPEFVNVLTALLNLASDASDQTSQRLAFSFFAKSVIAWGTSPEAASGPSVFADSASSEKSKQVANGVGGATNQHAVPKEERADKALESYERFIYQRLLPLCFEVPGNTKFNVRGGQPVLYEIATLIRNTAVARGEEAITYLTKDLLPKLQCPDTLAEQLVGRLRTQQAKDWRKTFAEFVKAMKA